MVEALPRWALGVVALCGVAIVAWLGFTVMQPDSPWCVDSGGPGTDVDCPIEVRFDDDMYVVECIEAVMPVRQGERVVQVRQHDGESITTRSAREIEGISIEDVMLLDATDVSICPGHEIAYSTGLSSRDATALVQASAVPG